MRIDLIMRGALAAALLAGTPAYAQAGASAHAQDSMVPGSQPAARAARTATPYAQDSMLPGAHPAAPAARTASPHGDSVVLGTQPAGAAPTAPPRARRPGHVLNINGDRTIGAGEVVEGDVVVLNGDLTVAGEVRGDVTVARGDLRLENGAVVTGSAVVTAGRLVNRGARVQG